MQCGVCCGPACGLVLIIEPLMVFFCFEYCSDIILVPSVFKLFRDCLYMGYVYLPTQGTFSDFLEDLSLTVLRVVVMKCKG